MAIKVWQSYVVIKKKVSGHVLNIRFNFRGRSRRDYQLSKIVKKLLILIIKYVGK